MPQSMGSLAEKIVDAANSGVSIPIMETLEDVTASAAELNLLDGVTATTAEINLNDNAAATVTVAIAASETTDGMDITVTVKDAAGATIAAVHALDLWMSEAATGIGLTADTYSGTLTASTGAILTTLTAKKHFSVVTAATGIFVGTLVDSANPVDQYVVVKNPFDSKVVVSEVSGTNWEGAA